MTVVDASVVANLVADDGLAGSTARRLVADLDRVVVPDLLDVECVAVFRRRWLAGDLSDRRFGEAVDDLRDLPFARVAVGPLMPRAFELRHELTVYDACYVALAEALGTVLITADTRLASAPGITCPVEVMPPL